MEIIYPFKKEFPISSSYEHHLASGGERAKYAGVDYGTPEGEEVFSPIDGFCSSHIDSYGGVYALVVGGKYLFILLHLQRVTRTGQVQVGDHIGITGNTGWTSGPHTHIEMRINGKNVNPTSYLLNKKLIVEAQLREEIQQLKMRIHELETYAAKYNQLIVITDTQLQNINRLEDQKKQAFETLENAYKENEKLRKQLSKFSSKIYLVKYLIESCASQLRSFYELNRDRLAVLLKKIIKHTKS